MYISIFILKLAACVFLGIYAAKNEQRFKAWLKSRIAAISGNKKS